MNKSAIVSVQQIGKTLTICFLESRLNAVRADNEPWETIDQSIETGSPDTLVLDFANVTVLCSAVLAKLIGLKKKFQGKVVLMNLSELLREVIHVTGFDRMFIVKNNLD
jgi:anti-anti-sigma factor